MVFAKDPSIMLRVHSILKIHRMTRVTNVNFNYQSGVKLLSCSLTSAYDMQIVILSPRLI